MRVHDDGPVPNLEELRKLIAFEQAGGVTSAAAELGMEQSTLSRQLAVFKQPGADNEPVLKKDGNQLKLTPKGAAVLPAIRDLIRQYEQLLAFVNGEADAPQIVRLGLGAFAQQHYLPRALVELRRKNLRLELDLEITRGEERILGVASGRFDLAVVTHDPLQIETMLSVHLKPKPNLVVEPLSLQPFCVAAGRKTAAAKELATISPRKSVPLEKLSRWELVGLDSQSGIRRLIERELRKKRLTLRFVPHTGTGGWPAAKEYARQNLGAAILPLAALDPADADRFTIRRLSDRCSIQDYVIHRESELNSVQKRMKEELMQAGKILVKEVVKRWN